MGGDPLFDAKENEPRFMEVKKGMLGEVRISWGIGARRLYLRVELLQSVRDRTSFIKCIARNQGGKTKSYG